MKSDRQHPQHIPIPDSLLYPDSFDVDDDVEEIEEEQEYNSFGLNLGAETPKYLVEEPRLVDDDLLDRFNNASSSSASTSDALQNVPGRSRLWRSASFYDKHKRGTKLQKETVDRDCDICFEIAVAPARTLCCGKLYCYEHIYDWLHGPSSDGRCPSCGARCSADTGILYLKAPPKYTESALPSKSPKSPARTATSKTVPSISTSGIERRRPSRSDTVSSSASSSSSSSSSDEDMLSPDSASDTESPVTLHHSGLYLPKSSSGTSTPLPVPVDTAETASKVAGNILSLVGLTLVFYVLVS